jgi:RNA polymerase sigma-70 factor (ECF subfamily)
MAVPAADQSNAPPPKIESIEELFTALESPLLHYALRLMREREAAEELVQEAFMKLHTNFARVSEPRRWLYRTVHNLALNQQRHAGKTISLSTMADAQTECAELVDPQPLPDEEIARWEGIGLVRLTLDNLDARSRELIHLKFTEGLSYQEMSARLGLTEGHVGYLLHHALKAIADELARNGGMR